MEKRENEGAFDEPIQIALVRHLCREGRRGEARPGQGVQRVTSWKLRVRTQLPYRSTILHQNICGMDLFHMRMSLIPESP